MYPDFSNSRLVKEFREKSRSPSPSRPSTRPTSGRLFPLTDWLDDKVFDWSRADDSDYDDVFFFLDQQNKNVVGRRASSSEQNSPNSRSRANSNASSEGGNGLNGIGFRMEACPKVEVMDFDEDSGYHGDQEIESKKRV
jgi:glycerol-3-phosphate O-acyltransferase/dihydroxyacetone phosphate acyltransferase